MNALRWLWQIFWPKAPRTYTPAYLEPGETEQLVEQAAANIRDECRRLVIGAMVEMTLSEFKRLSENRESKSQIERAAIHARKVAKRIAKEGI